MYQVELNLYMAHMGMPIVIMAMPMMDTRKLIRISGLRYPI